jgi:hypothetical protein
MEKIIGLKSSSNKILSFAEQLEMLKKVTNPKEDNFKAETNTKPAVVGNSFSNLLSFLKGSSTDNDFQDVPKKIKITSKSKQPKKSDTSDSDREEDTYFSYVNYDLEDEELSGAQYDEDSSSNSSDENQDSESPSSSCPKESSVSSDKGLKDRAYSTRMESLQVKQNYMFVFYLR